MHDAPFVSSPEVEWTVARFDHAYGCALNAYGAVDIPDELRPKALFIMHI